MGLKWPWDACQDLFDSICQRPSMYGTPSQVEMALWVCMGLWETIKYGAPKKRNSLHFFVRREAGLMGCNNVQSFHDIDRPRFVSVHQPLSRKVSERYHWSLIGFQIAFANLKRYYDSGLKDRVEQWETAHSSCKKCHPETEADKLLDCVCGPALCKFCGSTTADNIYYSGCDDCYPAQILENKDECLDYGL